MERFIGGRPRPQLKDAGPSVLLDRANSTPRRGRTAERGQIFDSYTNSNTVLLKATKFGTVGEDFLMVNRSPLPKGRRRMGQFFTPLIRLTVQSYQIGKA